MDEATPVAMGEMIAQLHQLARKQEGYGMSFSDPSPRQGGMASINLYGDRAKSAIWLFKNAAVIATALDDMQRRVEELEGALREMLSEFDAEEFGSEGQMRVCWNASQVLSDKTQENGDSHPTPDTV